MSFPSNMDEYREMLDRFKPRGGSDWGRSADKFEPELAATFLLLRTIWDRIHRFDHRMFSADQLELLARKAERANRPMPAWTNSLAKLLELGAESDDLAVVVQEMQADLAFQILYLLDDLTAVAPNGDVYDLGLAVCMTDENCCPDAGRHLWALTDLFNAAEPQ